MFERFLGRLFPSTVLDSFERKTAAHKIKWKRGSFAVSISFDCEYRRDIDTLPSLLDILSTHSFKTSFACIGKWVEEYPKQHRMIIEEGHEVLNHTYSHPYNEELNPRKFAELTNAEVEEEIKRCDEACRKVLGRGPIGFRTPHFGRQHTQREYALLRNLGYVYSSSKIATHVDSGAMPFIHDGIVELPVSPCPKHPWNTLDSYHSLQMGAHTKEGEFRSLFERLTEIISRNGGFVNIYVDPFHVVKNKDFIGILDHIESKKGEAWITSMAEIAKWYLGK